MMTRIIRISDGRSIGSYMETSDCWSLIQQVVNDEWPCWPEDDIDTRETDDGEELILVRGVPVARLEYGGLS